jgi:hypothetical protein
MRFYIPNSELEQMRTHKPYIYVATPYSRHPQGREVAYLQACEAGSYFLHQKVPSFVPIVYFHPIHMIDGAEADNLEFWIEADRPFIETSAGMALVKLPGWEYSSGIAEEKRLFKEAKKPIFMVEAYS